MSLLNKICHFPLSRLSCSIKYLITPILFVESHSIITAVRVSEKNITSFIKVRHRNPLSPCLKVNSFYLIMDRIVYLFYRFTV